MRVIVNGKEVHLERKISIAEFLRSKGIRQAAAVEHNLKWTLREDWPHIQLKENDRIEIIQMMAGG